jgi:hypothetical protein
MPFTSVVLPVPRSPRSSSSCGGFSSFGQLAAHLDGVRAALRGELVHPAFGGRGGVAHSFGLALGRGR